MDSINEMKELLENKDNKIDKIRKDLLRYTGIKMTDNEIIYLYKKWSKELDDLDTNENFIGHILVDYDEYAMANITEEQSKKQKEMEAYATESFSTVYGASRYYKLEDTYFVWNEAHRKEHEERENKIEEVAYDILHNVKKICVDTRKAYGEVRYVLHCITSDNKHVIVMCHRFDKKHIRIITAWKEV